MGRKPPDKQQAHGRLPHRGTGWLEIPPRGAGAWSSANSRARRCAAPAPGSTSSRSAGSLVGTRNAAPQSSIPGGASAGCVSLRPAPPPGVLRSQGPPRHGLDAVDPTHQGSGLGTAVVSAGLTIIDQQEGTVALETSDLRSVRLYQRLGFATATTTAVPEGPIVYAMNRAAQSSPAIS